MNELQDQVIAWEKFNFPNATIEQNALGVCEEAGELAHCVLKQAQGIRAVTDDKMKDAIGDIIIFLFNLCGKKGWNLEDIIQETWRQVSQRDWIRNPIDGQ